MATTDWYFGFMHCNSQLSLTKPGNTSVHQIKVVNKKNAIEFFEKYSEVRVKNGITSDRIFNFDETGVSTVIESPIVVVPRGMKQISQATSAERGSQISLGALNVVNTAVNFLLLVYILPSRLRTRAVKDKKYF